MGRAEHPELKFIAGKGQRRGAVSVRGVFGDGRQDIDADAHDRLFQVCVVGAVNNGFHHGFQFVAQEDGYDGRRRFVGAQAVIVTGGGDGATEPVLILIHAFDKRREKHQELCVLTGCAAWLKEIFSRVGTQRPVVVFSGAVDAGKGLFMEQTDQAMLFGGFFMISMTNWLASQAVLASV